MARTDSLSHFLTDIAESIRTKEGTEEQISASEFDTRIANLPSGGSIPEKGVVINAWDGWGYATDISIVGFTEIPDNYCSTNTSVYGEVSFFGRATRIELPNNLTSIGSSAFNNMSELKTIELPISLTSMMHSAFAGCTDLALTELPNRITLIDSAVFLNCKNLALTELPSGITSINNASFSGCTNLALTELPRGITLIDNGAFKNCTNLALIELPDGITSIGQYAFEGCTNLALTKLPGGITSIAPYAFNNCTNLALTELSSEIGVINQYGFGYCTGLNKITILGANTTIGQNSFYGCSNLTMIAIPNATSVPKLSNTNAFTSTPIKSGTGYIYVPNDLVDSFKSATNWSAYANQIKSIGELDLFSINIQCKSVLNLYYNEISTPFDVTYNGRSTSLSDATQEGYTLSINGNATINGDVLTLTDDAQAGDIITVTVTSTYNPNISATKEIKVISRDVSIDVNLNDGQWIDSGTTANNGNVIYKSDAGSYNISSGSSTAILNVKGYTHVELYIRNSGENDYDYIETFAVDTQASRGKGLYQAKTTSTTYTKCVYELDGGTHTIEIMYSKDSGGNQNDDRGYFYIGEVS